MMYQEDIVNIDFLIGTLPSLERNERADMYELLEAAFDDGELSPKDCKDILELIISFEDFSLPDLATRLEPAKFKRYGNPLASKLIFSLVASNPTSSLLETIEKNRRESLELLKAPPQELFEKYLSGELDKIVECNPFAINPLCIPSGKISIEIEADIHPMDSPAIRGSLEGTTFEHGIDGNNITPEIRRKNDNSPNAYANDQKYIFDIFKMINYIKINRVGLLNEDGSEISIEDKVRSTYDSLHVHLDGVLHKYRPLDEILFDTKVNPLGTYEVRGIYPPTYNLSLEPAQIININTLLILASTQECNSEEKIFIKDGVKVTEESMIWGQICTELTNPEARLAALLILKRSNSISYTKIGHLDMSFINPYELIVGLIDDRFEAIRLAKEENAIGNVFEEIGDTIKAVSTLMSMAIDMSDNRMIEKCFNLLIENHHNDYSTLHGIGMNMGSLLLKSIETQNFNIVNIINDFFKKLYDVSGQDIDIAPRKGFSTFFTTYNETILQVDVLEKYIGFLNDSMKRGSISINFGVDLIDTLIIFLTRNNESDQLKSQSLKLIDLLITNLEDSDDLVSNNIRSIVQVVNNIYISQRQRVDIDYMQRLASVAFRYSESTDSEVQTMGIEALATIFRKIDYKLTNSLLEKFDQLLKRNNSGFYSENDSLVLAQMAGRLVTHNYDSEDILDYLKGEIVTFYKESLKSTCEPIWRGTHEHIGTILDIFERYKPKSETSLINELKHLFTEIPAR